MEKKILFISYVFPPTGGAGIQRTVKLVKYFYKTGWEPIILTAKNPSVPVFDYEILKDIPDNIRIYKSLSLEIPYSLKRRLWKDMTAGSKQDAQPVQNSGVLKFVKNKLLTIAKFFVHLIMIPDPQVGWNFFTSRAAKKIIKKYNIRYVFISAPPFSSLLLVSRLSKTGAKVIADFRDEWTEFYLKSYDFHQRDNFTSKKIIKMEQEVIKSASLITMATQSFVNNYSKKYPQYSSKIKLLTNGYDPEDFRNVKNEKNNGNKFSITYTGTIFNVTTAQYLLTAVKNLLNKDKKLKKIIELNFVGRITDEEKKFFDEFPFKENIKLIGYVTHKQSISYLYQSDLLVVIVDELEGSDRIIAAKVFEYIYTGIPILALVPRTGEIANIINSTQTGVVVSNRNIEEIEKTIDGVLNKKYSFKRNISEINKYSREKIANILIDYIGKV